MGWNNTLPVQRDFGHEFNYQEWDGKTSEITLYQVPWSSDYRDTYFAPRHQDLHDYLATRPSRKVTGMSYLKQGDPIRVSIPVNVAQEYNYAVVYNPPAPTGSGTPDQGRWLYYFINDVRNDATNTTRLMLQLDAWQMFIREFVFGQAFFEQGHVGIAENTVVPGKPGLLTQPEGMNLGSDYTIAGSKTFNIATNNEGYYVVVTSTLDLEGDAGTLKAPNRDSATGSDWEGLPNGASLYVFGTPFAFTEYIKSMSTKAWKLEGIVSITAVPRGIFQTESSVPQVQLNGYPAWKPGKQDLVKTHVHKMWVNYRASIMGNFETRYQHLLKFTTHPYSFLEMSTYSGEALVLKPELWADNDATIIVKSHLAPPSPRIGIRPFNYNTEYPGTLTTGANPDAVDTGESWNVATWLSNFPQFSVVNNGYITTMASQANSLQASYRDLGWQQNRATAANQLSYNQATSGMNLSNDLTANSTSAMAAQTNLSNVSTGFRAAQSGVNSIVSGAASGGGPGAIMGVAGAVNSAFGAAVDINQNTQSNAIQTRMMQSQNDLSVGNSGYMRDTNKNYADFATQGDYQNAIGMLNAKVEDAKMTMPTTAGTVGGDAFMLAIEGWTVRMKMKIIPRGARQALGDYWLRYGYAINRFGTIPPNFQCMEVFTYWKMKEVYVLSAKCPEPMKQAIRGILEKGVTVWHDPNRMGEHTAMMINNPIYGKYLLNSA